MGRRKVVSRSILFARPSIDIRLDKTQYAAGETLRGVLVLSANKRFDAQGLTLTIRGEEITDVRVVEGEGSGGPSVRKFKYSHVFLHEDIMSHRDILSGIGAKIFHFHIEIPAGDKEVPFEFKIPDDALESYEGKKAWIRYTLEAKLERTDKLDAVKRIPLCIVNPSPKKGPKIKTSAEYYHGLPQYKGPYGFRQYKGPHIMLELENNTFSPGETITGRVTVKGTEGKRVRKIQVILYSREIAKPNFEADERKYGKYYEIFRTALTGSEGPDYSKSIEETIMEEYPLNIEDIPEVDHEGSVSVPFEILIPENAKKSYDGHYSWYSWKVKAKVDRMLRSDANAVCDIKIV